MHEIFFFVGKMLYKVGICRMGNLYLLKYHSQVFVQKCPRKLEHILYGSAFGNYVIDNLPCFLPEPFFWGKKRDLCVCRQNSNETMSFLAAFSSFLTEK